MAWLGRFDDFNQFDDDGLNKNASFKYQKQTTNPGKSPTVHSEAECKRLCDIKAGTSVVTLKCVIIAKEQARSIFSKKNIGDERHLISLIVRDSPSCFACVTCWGSAEFVNHINDNFHIGDIVQIRNVQVHFKANNQSDEKFKPWTPLSFHLTLSENHSSLEHYTGWDAANFRGILTMPTRPSNDYHTLEEINVSGAGLQGEHVNILAAVRKVGQIRHLTTKSGKQTKKCEVVLFDDTCPTFILDLWDSHTNHALLWTPFQTVIFAADVKISFNAFKSSMVATADCKTIFTMDPDTQEAHYLRQFIGTQDNNLNFEFDQTLDEAEPDFSSISEVFTVKQLKEKRFSMSQDSSASSYYGILYAMLTTFNIDAGTSDVIRKICCHCKKSIGNSVCAICTNPDCKGSLLGPQLDSVPAVSVEYNVIVAVSDHTGTVNSCYLRSTVAETLLGCTAQAFLSISEDQRTEIKWRYFLERCKIVFKLHQYKHDMSTLPSVQILSLERMYF